MKHSFLSETTCGAAVQEAYTVLASGGIILYPTDTLYGLAADATNVRALKILQELKGRELDKPFSVVVSDMRMAKEYAHITPLAQQLFDAYLPGPLTLILAAASRPLSTHISKEGTVAIRIPDNQFCIKLAHALGRPYTATSANLSGQKTRSVPEDILHQLGEKASLVDLVVDAGTLPDTLGSTIVDARGDRPLILRQGLQNIHL